DLEDTGPGDGADAGLADVDGDRADDAAHHARGRVEFTEPAAQHLDLGAHLRLDPAADQLPGLRADRDHAVSVTSPPSGGQNSASSGGWRARFCRPARTLSCMPFPNDSGAVPAGRSKRPPSPPTSGPPPTPAISL